MNANIPNLPLNNNMLNMVNQFKQFKNTFKGNPRDTVMQMVNSGRISQEDLNRAQQMAKQFQQILGQM